MCERSETMALCNERTGPHSDQLSERVLRAFCELAAERAMLEFNLETHPVSGVGENSYGDVLQVKLTPTRTLPSLMAVPPFYSIVKISPKNAARRAHMHVVDYYSREVFMYESVFGAFNALQEECERHGVEVNGTDGMTPKMLYHSLEPEDEFIVFEDLTQRRFAQNLRTRMPTEDLAATALVVLAQLHALSFVLQAKRPQTFAALVSQMYDNLFTDDIEPVTVEFGKKYVRRTRTMLEADLKQRPSAGADDRRGVCVEVLDRVEQDFKKTCLRCVDGAASAPYAVICHGDFWNNNILYRYDENDRASSAILIDFQMSRYAPPVLDLVHYIFVCTDKSLRDTHFQCLLDVYYDALAAQMHLYGLDAADLYPRAVYTQQLRAYGVYGLCMASFSLPFFISNTSELFDLDEVSQAIQDLPDTSDMESAGDERQDCCTGTSAGDSNKLHELLDGYDLLTPRTEPIFRRRMTGVVNDLVQYQMVEQRLLPTTTPSGSDDS